MARYQTRDGERLYYRQLGRGKQTLILLHGFGMHSGHWLPFSATLAHRYRVITPDLRGFGKSHLSHFNEQKCSVSQFADDLEDLCASLHLENVKLAGISMGALTALKYFEQHGHQRISHYLHIDQSPCCMNKPDWEWGLFGDAHQSRIEQAEQLLSALKPYMEERTPYTELPVELQKATQYQLGEFFASALSRPSHKFIARKLMQNQMLSSKIMPTENWTVYMACLSAYIREGYDLRNSLTAINIPLTLMIGMRSEMYPPAGQLRIADKAQRCKVVPFIKSGHTPLIDEPIKFTRELLRFAQS